MDQYRDLGRKAAMAGRRETRAKLDKKKPQQKATMYGSVTNQQDPYRYGQKVRSKE